MKMKMKRERIMGFFLALVMFIGYLPLNPTASYANGDVEINKDNFPDENFRKYVSDNFDKKPRNGKLSDGELDNVKWIDISDKSVTSLQGIEHFKNLTHLNCSGNKLTKLDVSNNRNLTILKCNRNQLNSLDVKNNKNLTYLCCFDNSLTSLDVSNNKNLTHLDCCDNKLASLDVRNNKNLTYLYCFGNSLTSLDLSNNKNLIKLSCNHNNLTSLDLSNNKKLTYLYCRNQQYNITVIKGIREFKYSNFPRGFNKDKVILPAGASFGKDTLTVNNDTINEVTYKYKVSDSPSDTRTMDVKLNVNYKEIVKIGTDPKAQVPDGYTRVIFDAGEGNTIDGTNNRYKVIDVLTGTAWDNAEVKEQIPLSAKYKDATKVFDKWNEAVPTTGTVEAKTFTAVYKAVGTPAPQDPPVVGPVDSTDPNGGKPADTSKYYTVTFESEDETKGTVDAKNTVYVLKTENKTLADITAPKVTAKAGYEFDKWEPALDKNTVIDKDLTVKAYFKKVKEKSYNKKPQVSNNSKIPKTANSMNIELYTFFMILSAALLVVVFKRKKSQ